jgi:uncharacterized protein (DUF2345 family)
MDEGQAMVKDLDPVYCPCGKNRILASGSSPFFYSNDSASEPAQSSTPTRAYDEQFTLTDAAGKALPDTYYTVRMPSGSLVHGVTDAQGHTARHETSSSQSIRIYLGHKQEA